MLSNEELLVLFEETLSSDFERFTDKTIEQNVKYVRRFLDVLGKPALEVSQTEIKQYMTNLCCLDGSPMNIDSKQVHLSKIKNFFKFLYTTDEIDVVKDRYYNIDGQLIPKQNPAEGIRPINTSKAAKLERNAQRVGLTEYDADRLLTTILTLKEESKKDMEKELLTRDYAMVKLMLERGQRVSDVINLDTSNFERNEDNVWMMNFVITKTKTPSSLPLDNDTMGALFEYWKLRNENTTIAFTSKNGKRLDTRDINRMLKKYAVLAGIDEKKLSCHILRHTCGANLYEKNHDANLVRTVLGQKSLSSTQRYITNNDSDKLIDNLIAN